MVYSNNFNQVRVGIRNGVVTQVVNAVDADAQAFITAAGITNLTQASAINVLVNDLKTYGLWTKMKALYPFVGGSAASHKFNLKDPRDVDAAYRLSFSGGWVHTTTGAKPNGINTYADTKLAPNVMGQNSIHASFYSRTDISGYYWDLGAYTESGGGVVIGPRYQNGSSYVYMNNKSNDNTADNNPIIGLYMGNRTSSTTNTLFRNGVIIVNGTKSSFTPISLNIYLGAYNEGTVVVGYSPREQAFASIGDGLSDTEATNFYTSVQKFQTTLGRQIGSPIVSDTDAQAFINAAGLTDLGQANAVNTLVVDLKAAGVWTKMKALYPFVGGTATTHKWNLKDPRDLDVAFRLTFSGGWTHAATGALPNGTTGYADTFLIPSTNLTNYSSHLSLYSRTTRVGANKIQGAYQGSPTFNQFAIQIRSTSNTTVSIQYDGATGNDYASFTDTNSIGFYIANRSAINLNKINLNGVVRNTNTISSTKSLPNTRFLLGALSTGVSTVGYYDDLQLAFSSIGDGLTDAESTAFYTAVQKFQTTLGRQIGTPVLAEGQTAGLLETYSGAAAAYSLRKLRTGYVGNAIRVRRSSDNTEQDIAFKTDGTLDTTSLLAFVGSGNGFVTTWYDQSSNGYNMLQTTATAQPQIVSSGNMILENGKPTVSFTSNSKKLQTINLPLSFYDCSLSYVSRNISRTAYACGIFGYGNNAQYSGTRYLGTSFGANTLTFIYFGADVATNLSGAGDTKLALYSLNYQSNTVNIYKDNSTYNSSVSLSNTSTAKFAINDIADRGEMATINFSEGIFYTTGQSSNMSNIRANQNSYYSIY